MLVHMECRHQTLQSVLVWTGDSQFWTNIHVRQQQQALVSPTQKQFSLHKVLSPQDATCTLTLSNSICTHPLHRPAMSDIHRPASVFPHPSVRILMVPFRTRLFAFVAQLVARPRLVTFVTRRAIFALLDHPAVLQTVRLSVLVPVANVVMRFATS